MGDGGTTRIFNADARMYQLGILSIYPCHLCRESWGDGVNVKSSLSLSPSSYELWLPISITLYALFLLLNRRSRLQHSALAFRRTELAERF